MRAEAGGGAADVLDAVRRRWVVALVVTAALFGGVLWYAERIPNGYDATAVVAFAPQPGAAIGADTIRVVLPKYVAYLTSRATARTLAERLGEDEQGLLSAIDVSVAPETANLTIRVRLGDPDRAAAVAAELAREGVALSTVDSLLRGQLIAPALADPAPASPPRRLIEAGGLLLALLAGLSAAVLVDRSRPRITDPLAAALVSGHGVVGRIPRSRSVRLSPLEALADPQVGTAVRAMRTQLEQQARSAPVRVLAVTSSTAGEGKTTVACALAGAFARVDVRVLLLDGDMRRPKVAEALDLDDEQPGLPDLLEGRATLAQARQTTEIDGLDVVVTGVSEDAGDLLARRLSTLLESVRDAYDVVVLDCPPLLSTDDARTLAAVADATLLVVSSGTESRLLAEAAAGLDALRVRVVGVVLNRVRPSRGSGVGAYGAYRAS